MIVSTATHQSKPQPALCRFQEMKRAGWFAEFQVAAQSGEPAEWSLHRLYLRLLFPRITGLITSVGFFPASCGSEKFPLLKEQLPVIAASPSVRSAACYCRISPALTSGFCRITKQSRLTWAFIPVWTGTEQRVPPCPHCADTERDTVMRQKGGFESEQMHTGAQAYFI